jgi:two-component system chemotaxis response regulator CheY
VADWDLSRLRVVVIDDNHFSRDLASLCLSALGVKEIYAADGAKSGMDAMRANAPDIVLVDWVMEPVDGIGFVKAIRGNKRNPFRFLPLMIVSAYSEQWRVEEARDSGANEFVVKPFSAYSLYTKIRGIIESPRPFVEVPDGYFGPDRRRRNSVVATERRQQGAGVDRAIDTESVPMSRAPNPANDGQAGGRSE